MASKKSRTKIYIYATKHKGGEVWKVAIDEAGNGPMIELKERYSRARDARRGAKRRAVRMGISPGTLVFIHGRPSKN